MTQKSLHQTLKSSLTGNRTLQARELETAEVRPKAGGNCGSRKIRLGQVSGSTVQQEVGKEKTLFILREVRAGLNET